MQTILIDNEHGFKVYDIINHEFIKKSTIRNNIKINDYFNVWAHDDEKFGCKFLGNFKKSLNKFKPPMRLYALYRDKTPQSKIKIIAANCKRQIHELIKEEEASFYESYPITKACNEIESINDIPENIKNDINTIRKYFARTNNGVKMCDFSEAENNIINFYIENIL
jgi:hypothetical protein